MQFRTRAVLALTTAGAVAAGVVGVTAAQTPPGVDVPSDGQDQARPPAPPERPRPPGPGRVLATQSAEFLGLETPAFMAQLQNATPGEIAARQGSSAEALTAHLVGLLTMHIDQRVADGRMDADRAEEIKAEATARIARWVAEGGWGEPGGGRHGERPGRPGRRAEGEGRPLVEIAAQTLGVGEEVVIAGLRSGLSLADVATANGSSGEALVQAALGELSARLAAAVEAGRLTADEAAERLAAAESHLTEAIHRTPPSPALPPEGEAAPVDAGIRF